MEASASVKTWVRQRRSVYLLCVTIVLGHRLQAEDLQTSLSDFEGYGISLWAQSDPEGGWVEESSQELARYERGRGFDRYLVYYGYNETALSPGSSEKAYLHLSIVDLAQPAGRAPGTNRVWYQRYQLNVEGEFVDRNIELSLLISKANSKERGTLRVTPHQAWPISLLQPKHQGDMLIDLKTNASKSEGTPVEFANLSPCCAIQFKEGRFIRWDKELWNHLKVAANDDELRPGKEGKFQEWLSLSLVPNQSKAFWRSFSLLEGKELYSMLTYEVVFQVQGGREGRLQKNVLVRFEPPWPLVMFSAVLGALAASSLNFIYRKVRQGALPLFPRQKTIWSKAKVVILQIILSMGIAIVILFVYLKIKGNKDVILFDFHLDPSQCLPAFLIGCFVGLRPDFYFVWLKRLAGPRKPAVSFLGLFFLAAAPPAESGSLAGLRPVDLDFDTSGSNLYVLNSPTNRIDYVALPGGAVRNLTRVDPDGIAVSQCLFRWNDRLWVATLSHRSLSGDSGLRRVTLSLTGVDHRQSLSQMFTGYNQFFGIDFDHEHQRFLVTDRSREGIYAIPLGREGLGKPVLLLRDGWLREPVALIGRDNDLFVAAQGRHAVVQVNLQTGVVRPLVEELSEPADVALSPDGSRLLIVDAGKARILEHDLRTGSTKELLGGVRLREPRAVQMDLQGHLWVADSWLGVLEFVPNENTPLRRIR